MTNDKDFDWQEAQRKDQALADLHFAKKLARAETTATDAVEYLVCRGWSADEAKKALGMK